MCYLWMSSLELHRLVTSCLARPCWTAIYRADFEAEAAFDTRPAWLLIVVEAMIEWQLTAPDFALARMDSSCSGRLDSDRKHREH